MMAFTMNRYRIIPQYDIDNEWWNTEADMEIQDSLGDGVIV